MRAQLGALCLPARSESVTQKRYAAFVFAFGARQDEPVHVTGLDTEEVAVETSHGRPVLLDRDLDCDVAVPCADPEGELHGRARPTGRRAGDHCARRNVLDQEAPRDVGRGVVARVAGLRGGDRAPPAPGEVHGAPTTMQLPLAVNETGKPDDALAFTAKSGSPSVLSGIGSNVIVWFALGRATSAAGRRRSSTRRRHLAPGPPRRQRSGSSPARAPRRRRARRSPSPASSPCPCRGGRTA